MTPAWAWVVIDGFLVVVILGLVMFLLKIRIKLVVVVVIRREHTAREN
jgi:hypothetical protein